MFSDFVSPLGVVTSIAALVNGAAVARGARTGSRAVEAIRQVLEEALT